MPIITIIEDHWDVGEFVRGTLRLAGWSTAWQHIFDEVATLSGSSNQRLANTSQKLEHKYSYAADEADRVYKGVRT